MSVSHGQRAKVAVKKSWAKVAVKKSWAACFEPA